MRLMDANSLASLNGSRTGDTITAYVWYNDQLAYPDPLNISSWSMDWDATRQVQSLKIDVVDSTGELVPRLLEDVLGVGGSELQITYQVGGAGTVNMGWYRITNTKPKESWRSYIIDSLGQINVDSPIPPNKKLVYVASGSIISITAEDRAGNIARDRLEAPTSPQGASPTILSEISRLVGDICPVISLPTVVDRAVNKTLIMKDDRLNAVQDLCKRIGCDYRMNGDGQLEVYPVVTTAPVWNIHGGPEGVYVSVDWEQDIAGLRNVFIADGTGTQGGKQYPIRGRASISNGPISENGPFGRCQETYSSTMLTTQAQCDAYAIVMRDLFVASLNVVLKVVCAPHPGIQQGETVLIASPVVNGQTVDLIGTVQTMGLKSNGGTVDAMTLSVVCPYATVATVFRSVDRG